MTPPSSPIECAWEKRDEYEYPSMTAISIFSFFAIFAISFLISIRRMAPLFFDLMLLVTPLTLIPVLVNDRSKPITVVMIAKTSRLCVVGLLTVLLAKGD